MKCIICDKTIDTVRQEDGEYLRCNTCFSTYCLTCGNEHTIQCDECSEIVCCSDYRECENCGIRLCQECAIYDVEDMFYYCKSCNDKEE